MVKKEPNNYSEINDKLLENLIKLQKVHTDLAEKFDRLAKEISNLLALFELAARNFAKHPAAKMTEGDKEFLDKIDKLLEQNKTIAKGLTLMEEQMRNRLYESPSKQQPAEPIQLEQSNYMAPVKSRPLPRF